MLFTLEVLISILILAVAISIVLVGNNVENNQGTFVNFTNQSNRITTVYFDLTPPSETGETTICGDYIKYSAGTIITSQICEGYP